MPTVKELIDDGCQFHTGCKCERCITETGPSKQHQEAMDYIYDRAEFDEDDDGYTECEKCTRTINNYNEPTFVVGIYVDNIRVEQELWCKQCAVKGMKGDLS